ncbi:hypothetical protein PUMCH_002903 [Australozyma saopauloensis]|uniref:R3H domain-containing protein n=1 Tax=Australozyma saopauloensis TaxID=291208 RepID=A0AAX4HAJ2_9ASCO|nr:hypothetical protein PUMCH_002903 [[Candida] saopauloensis]
MSGLPPEPPEEPPSAHVGTVEMAANELSSANSSKSSFEEATPDISESNLDLDSESDLETELDSDLEQVDESLASTIVQEIEEGVYVCLVCTCEIDRHSQIWSCLDCYRVYDLECIRDWATRGSSTTAERRWRCPACHVEHKKLPERFTCWCGRKTNPRPDSMISFSCGNSCGHKYDTCVHQCMVQCHPGKHPTCGAMGPTMRCKCGAESQQLPCLMTPYETGWQCDSPCEVVVCSMGHRCPQKECHEGLCGACSEQISVLCYCGHETVETACSETVPRLGYKEDGSEIVGGVSCGRTVRSFYDCETHFEDLPCLPLPRNKPHCKLSPDVVKSCYCGKTAQSNINRTKCTDPMPVCNNPCGKKLGCGCLCKAQCHSGPCECYNSQPVKCGCGNCTFLVPCRAIEQGFIPKCLHKCTALLSCRKHVHKAVCCEFEQTALGREREMKRQIRNNLRANFNDQILTMELCHICTRDCNQLKKCGIHRCEALCHSGPCGVCLESSAEDLVCNCGKTVIPAPVRCGTKIQCTEQCIRIPACGHRPGRHQCHEDDVPCPRCTQPVTRRCECGLKEVKNVLCSVKSVSCGTICNVRKDCGHPCNRACLKECSAGDHAPVSQCPFECRKIRNFCPHMCSSRCHSGKNTSCDNVKCVQKVKLKCSCGNLEQTAVCGAFEGNYSVIGKCIPCDDDCAVKAREKELRAAFNVSLPPEPVYNEHVTSVYRRQRNWCRQTELKLLEFVSNYKDMVAAEVEPQKSLHFPAMLKPQRDFIHHLSESFNLYCESYDKEPNRAVFVHITDNTTEPSETIEQAVAHQDDSLRKAQFMEELRQKRLDDGFHNAILIKDVFFGVSKEDVERHVSNLLAPHPEVGDIVILWVKDSTYAFTAPYFATMDQEKENLLFKLLSLFKEKLRDNLVAFDCRMCLLDDDMTNVLKVDSANVMKEPLSKSAKQVDANAFAVLEQSMQ